MSHCMVTLTANAGISLVLGQKVIWIDALHSHRVPGFSTLSPELWAQLQRHPAFQAPDLICFTHCHGDHYDHDLVQQACWAWPRAKLILPEQAFPHQFFLEGPSMEFVFQDTVLHFFRLPHEGKAYAQVPHYGLLLSQNRFRILIAGDCEVASPALRDTLAGQAVNLAILDFPWLTLPQGRAFVREVILPEHLLVYHLPFPEDDCFGYRKAAEWAVGKLPEVPDIRLLEAPFPSEII